MYSEVGVLESHDLRTNGIVLVFSKRLALSRGIAMALVDASASKAALTAQKLISGRVQHLYNFVGFAADFATDSDNRFVSQSLNWRLLYVLYFD